MNLHDEPEVYLELIQATAESHAIPAVYVEKDYWVTLVLKRLNESEYREDIVFKGGTSLSKAHRLIHRFSEDIDLATRAEGLGHTGRKRLIKAVEQVVTQDLEYQAEHPQESKGSRYRKTAYAFPTLSDASQLGQVADTILVEINGFADPTPAEAMPVGSLIHDYLLSAERQDVIKKFRLLPFEVLVLNVERTLCEKVMRLIRAGYEADAIADFKRQIRHFYDITMILREERYRSFLTGDGFSTLLNAVQAADRTSMPGAGVWLDPPLVNARLFVETEQLWAQIRSEFRGSFKDMLYGDAVPDGDEVLRALSLVSASVQDMDETRPT